MFKLKWDGPGERIYETGIDRGVLYPKGSGENPYNKGVVWNGLVKVDEKSTGAESEKKYADNIEYLNLMSAEKFEPTIEAFTYPDEFAECDGSKEIADGITVGQQNRKPFGLSYRTRIGNDEESDEFGYKIHLVYGGIASPTDKSYETINETPDAITFSWDITTTPVDVPGHKPSAHVTVNSTKVAAADLKELEEILYGSETLEPRLPLPSELITLFGSEG